MCFLFQTIEVLSSVSCPELALRLYLQCAEVIYRLQISVLISVLNFFFVSFWIYDQAASDCDLEPVAYEFFTQAFILYEEEIAVIFSIPFCMKLFWQAENGNITLIFL